MAAVLEIPTSRIQSTQACAGTLQQALFQRCTATEEKISNLIATRSLGVSSRVVFIDQETQRDTQFVNSNQYGH
jgi:hypothetical protein